MKLMLPQAFLIADELLRTTMRLLRGLEFDEVAMSSNMRTFGVFTAIEPLLMALCKAGADRQQMHAYIRDHAMRVWEEVRRGHPNTLAQALCADQELLRHLPVSEIEGHLRSGEHFGLAPDRAREIARLLRNI